MRARHVESGDGGGMTEFVERVIAELVAVHEHREPPDVDQRTGAWWWGRADDDLQYAIGMADLIAREPIAGALYLAHVADDASQFRRIKDWGYGVAAEFAAGRTGGPRNRVRVEGYRPEWGRQAARDGLARALWPELAPYMPGRDARCQALGVGHMPYMRVRDAVERKAQDVRQGYRDDLANIVAERWTRDMRDRLAAITGRQ